MRTLALISCLLFGSSSLAKDNSKYLVESKIFVDGALVSSPQMHVLSGEPAEISTWDTQSKMTMSVVAEDRSVGTQSQVFLRFEIEYMTDGRVMKSSPQLLAKSGAQSTISIGDKEGRESLRMDIVATKQE